MSTLVLTEGRSRALRETEGPVAVCDERGRELGVLYCCVPADAEEYQLTPELQRELIRRMSMKDIEWKTTAEVLEYLKSLDPA